MSRRMKTTVAGVTLRRGPKAHNWYASIGPNNVAVEFRPHLGRYSRKPIDWNASRERTVAVGDVLLPGDRVWVARGVTLTECVEKVTALYWGAPECTHGSYNTFGRKDYPQGPDRGPWCPVCKEHVEL